MTFSQAAAANLVPLLARLVLCLAFLPMGWNKLMRDVDYSGEDAKRLREMGAVDGPAAATPVTLAALGPIQAGAATEEIRATSDEPAPPLSTSSSPVGSGQPVRAKGLYRIALMLDKQGWSYQVPLAWIAAITELVGGVCVLIGLFTRFWSLGLAVTMLVAFRLTSVAPLGEFGLFALPLDQYNRMIAQAGLAALALGLVFAGAGALSLDRALFRGAPPAKRGRGGRREDGDS